MKDIDRVPDLAHTEAVILGVLLSKAARKMYGLEILSRSSGLLKRGSLYVTLQRMETKGLVESSQEPRPKPEIGIARRLYKVTGLGERAFEQYRLGHNKLTQLMVVTA